ncbi:hypothetical protein N9X93_06010 [Alphaproteobacteria bacterium]|nr:hypothetical protein [Alphaproteobacteria bacterium]
MAESLEDKIYSGESGVQNSFLFESESDVYDLNLPDNYLQNTDVSNTSSSDLTWSENYEITSSDLLSGEDLFGPSVPKISAEINVEWIAALTAGTDLDLDLAYSSHELLTLSGDNTVYDTSTNNSLILNRYGLQEISTGSKTTDIFIEPNSSANILGDSSTVNLFVREDDLKNVQFEGHFEGIEFNLLLDSSDTIPKAEIDGDKLLLRGETTQEIDISNIDSVIAGVNVNFYSSDGLLNTQNLDPIFGTQDQSPTIISQSQSDTPASYSEQLLFEDDVEIIRVSKGQLDTTPAGESVASIFDGQSDSISNLEYEIESQMESIIDETSLLLETETMFLDPLDVFSDEDFL